MKKRISEKRRQRDNVLARFYTDLNAYAYSKDAFNLALAMAMHHEMEQCLQDGLPKKYVKLWHVAEEVYVFLIKKVPAEDLKECVGKYAVSHYSAMNWADVEAVRPTGRYSRRRYCQAYDWHMKKQQQNRDNFLSELRRIRPEILSQ